MYYILCLHARNVKNKLKFLIKAKFCNLSKLTVANIYSSKKSY